MAKKPPKSPPPSPLDDFDPDMLLGDSSAPKKPAPEPEPDEIVPIEDVAPLDDDFLLSESETIESVSDELVEDVIDPDLIVPEGEPDLFGGMTGHVEEAPAKKKASKLVEEPVEDSLLDIQATGDDDVIEPEAPAEVEVDGDELVEAGDELVAADDLDLDDDLVAEDKEPSKFSMEDDDGSEHEAETKGEMPALDEDDPFAGVGGDGAVSEGEDDADKVPAGVGAEDDPTEPYYEEEIPKPATHWFTWTLIAFNMMAALAAPYMLALAYAKRQDYTHAVLRTELVMLGLPSEEENTAKTAARVTLPVYRIPADEVKRIVDDRLKAAGVKTLTDPVKDLEEAYGKRIPPDYLTDAILKEHFGYFGVPYEPVKTVEGEMKRLEKLVVPAMEKAAEDAANAAGKDAAKREAIEKMLLPLTAFLPPTKEGTACAKLADRIAAAKGEKLDELYKNAVLRRMAFEFLLPLELFRPGETKVEVQGKDDDEKVVRSGSGMFLEWIGDLEKIPIKDVLERVENRIQSTYAEKYNPSIHFDGEWLGLYRDTIEKRQTMAFTMIALAQVRKPDGELLFPKMMERIPLVMGQYDFALACELYPRGLVTLKDRVMLVENEKKENSVKLAPRGMMERALENIRIDREGGEAPLTTRTRNKKDEPATFELVAPKEKDGPQPLARNKGFVDFYEDELERIRGVQYDIIKAKIRLADLEDQKKRYESLLKERRTQREDLLKKIAVARAKTAKNAEELRVFQRELFRYELELATSEEQLADLNRQIVEREAKLRGVKTP